jgi:hypothetical protein
MTNTPTVKIYLDHLETVVKDCTEELVKRLALRTEERAKLNIRSNGQIDTGFMVNSIYTIFANGVSGYSISKALAESETKSRKTGKEVDHSDDMAPEEILSDDVAAAVVVGANYAIYNEARNPFLYPAAAEASRELGQEAVQIFKEAGA